MEAINDSLKHVVRAKELLKPYAIRLQEQNIDFPLVHELIDLLEKTEDILIKGNANAN